LVSPQHRARHKEEHRKHPSVYNSPKSFFDVETLTLVDARAEAVVIFSLPQGRTPV
jgi:hypothetical protein